MLHFFFAADDPVRPWRNAFNGASAYLGLLRGRNVPFSEDDGPSESSQEDSEEWLPSVRSWRREPRSVEREQWVFDGCLNTLVVSTGFEPAQLPGDMEDFDCSFGIVSVSGGNVTGLSNVFTRGNNLIKLGECGLSARFHLGFNDLVVKGIGRVTSGTWLLHVTTDFTFDLRIPAVEAVLEISE